jgi:hypothetical protein
MQDGRAKKAAVETEASEAARALNDGQKQLALFLSQLSWRVRSTFRLRL